MNIAHRVVGYDKVTEKLVFEFDIPNDQIETVRNLVQVPAEQATTFGSFPLEQGSAWKVAWRLQLPMNVDGYDWFLEPVGH